MNTQGENYPVGNTPNGNTSGTVRQVAALPAAILRVALLPVGTLQVKAVLAVPILAAMHPVEQYLLARLQIRTILQSAPPLTATTPRATTGLSTSSTTAKTTSPQCGTLPNGYPGRQQVSPLLEAHTVVARQNQAPSGRACGSASRITITHLLSLWLGH
ncbi:hypothetical protein BDZ85DRAFT_267295 [Elsinoe ampelina]|uniref:Uncharacterized protein n=1 Tax=Elsinoe ampelina TaxID=302913 RepID=A0A6A6G375_9PEZI|nr:hypothetical protein BDZ85DRAFT_267295 [Elsinoe ampelina]